MKIRDIKRVEQWISKNEKRILIAYFAALLTFFFVQFYFLRNWDMLVRILNANYLFHNGFYFENQRALLESSIIGVFSFVLGKYAVYAMIATGELLLFFSLKRFSKIFSINFLILVLAFFNPYTISYVVNSGSEIFLIAFLLLFISSVKNRDYMAGPFFALAFLSKYDAIFFLPIILFYFNRNILDSIKRILVAIVLALGTLIPFFLYNLYSFGNFIYTFALTYLYTSNVGRLPSFNFTGFAELSVIAVLIVIGVFFGNKKLDTKRLTGLLKSKNILILAVCAAIAIFTYVDANGFFANNLGVFRFFLLPLAFLTLLVLAIFKDVTYLPFVLFGIVSIVLASVILYYQISSAFPMQDAYNALSVVESVYNTTNCTVASPIWVYLDYAGLPAMSYLPNGNSSAPILSFSPVNTTLPLLKQQYGFYLYGNSYCSYSKVQTNFLTMENSRLAYANETLLKNDACGWLFGEKNTLGLYSACNSVNSLAKAVFG